MFLPLFIVYPFIVRCQQSVYPKPLRNLYYCNNWYCAGSTGSCQPSVCPGSLACHAMSRVGLAVLIPDTHSSNESACTAGFPPMMSTCSTALTLSKLVLAAGTHYRAHVASNKMYPANVTRHAYALHNCCSWHKPALMFRHGSDTMLIWHNCQPGQVAIPARLVQHHVAAMPSAVSASEEPQ